MTGELIHIICPRSQAFKILSKEYWVILIVSISWDKDVNKDANMLEREEKYILINIGITSKFLYFTYNQYDHNTSQWNSCKMFSITAIKGCLDRRKIKVAKAVVFKHCYRKKNLFIV